MLKKFFIGLIILSALVSEGGAVFQAEYCSMILYAQSGMCVLGNTNEMLVSSSVNKRSAFSLKDALSSFKLSFDKEQLKYTGTYYDFAESSYKFDSKSDFISVNDRYDFIGSREPVVEGTDSSPPDYCNIIYNV